MNLHGSRKPYIFNVAFKTLQRVAMVKAIEKFLFEFIEEKRNHYLGNDNEKSTHMIIVIPKACHHNVEEKL